MDWTDIGAEQGPNFTPPTLLNTSTLYIEGSLKANGVDQIVSEFSNTHTIYVNDTDPGVIDVNSARTFCYGTNPPAINSTTEAVSSFGVRIISMAKKNHRNLVRYN